MDLVRKHAGARLARAVSVRTYASGPPAPKPVKIKEPKVLPYQQTRKELSDRKVFLYNKYQRLFQESELILLLETENVSVALMESIRKAMAKIPFPAADKERLDRLAHEEWTLPTASLTMARTGLLRPVCRADTSEAIQALQPHLNGQVVLLSSRSLSPQYIGKVLRAIERPIASAAGAIDANSGIKPPRMTPVAAVVERRKLFDAKALPAMTKLPSLPVLQSQLVGLLSTPGQQLASILSQAGGGTLAATLEARRRDLAKDADTSA